MVYFVSLDIYEGIGTYTLVCQTLLSIGHWEKYTYDTCDPYQRIGIHTLVIVVSEVCSDIYFSLGGILLRYLKWGVHNF